MTAVVSAGPDYGAPASGPRDGRRSARVRLVVCIAIIVGALGWIAVRGLTGSFVYYLTPSDIVVEHKADVAQRVRLGGYVVPGSVDRENGTLSFTVSDGAESLQVVSTGPVPQLFRPGQGVVLEGSVGDDDVFHSDTLLVKHDGEYRAPDVDVPKGG